MPFALALLGGACLWLSLPDRGLWWLAPVGVALLAVATRGRRKRTGALLGFLAGLAYFVPTLSWSASYLSALPWLALASVQSLYLAALGAASAALQTRRGALVRTRPVGIALLWVGQEYLRSWTPYGGFPWARLAFGQADGPYARFAALAGVPGVAFAVALSGALLAAAWLPRSASTPSAPGGEAARLGAAGGAVLIALAGFTVPVGHLNTVGTADVVAVQGNVPAPGLEFNAHRRAVLDNHVRATVAEATRRDGAGLAAPDLVVWPENASDIDPVGHPDAGEAIRSAVSAIDAPVLLGTLRVTPQRLENLSYLYLPGRSRPVAEYVKRHPAPFAEYIPHRSFWRLFSSEVDLLTRDYDAGDAVGIMDVPAAGIPGRTPMRVGDLICFEVAYDDLTADLIDRDAELLVVQTNNATFGFSAESAQQLAISRLRAIETGRSVVHVSTVGISALISPDGVAHQRTELFTTAVVHDTLPLVQGRLPSAWIGPWLPWLTLAGLVAVVATGRAGRPRRGLPSRGQPAGGR